MAPPPSDLSHSVQTTDSVSYPYIFEKNVTVPLKNGSIIRCNVYLPKRTTQGEKFPVIATLGAYGKDVHYSYFRAESYKELNPDHKTDHSSWETPTPAYWTAHGYVVVRADAVGVGQSPGYFDPWSATTIDSFVELIEWASEQKWSTGKVGLLGISYYAATQWQVAARNPKGLAAIIPWEGFSDFYRDTIRHGGILSNGLVGFVWEHFMAPNQYGLPGRASRNWGDDTLEGDLSEEELQENRASFMEDMRSARFRDDELFASTNFNLEDIRVPLLSVANWGGITLHLRGNVQGFMHASSEYKYLRFIVGRHDLPFYTAEEVEVQRSFLDAFLKDEDRVGWSRKGVIAPVDLVLRKGNVGYNDPEAEKLFLRRPENEWPISRTKYTRLFLCPGGELGWLHPTVDLPCKTGYTAFGSSESQSSLTFSTPAFESEMEITGHIVVHLNVSMSRERGAPTPKDIDLFVALRHVSQSKEEILYTGTTGEGAPVSMGWLRVSMRKTNPQHRRHRPWLPYRDYLSTDALPVIPNEVYDVDIEIIPTNVVVQKGEQLMLEIGSKGLTGLGVATHDDDSDRSEEKFKGTNFIHFGPDYSNYLTVPVIPNTY